MSINTIKEKQRKKQNLEWKLNQRFHQNHSICLYRSSNIQRLGIKDQGCQSKCCLQCQNWQNIYFQTIILNNFDPFETIPLKFYWEYLSELLFGESARYSITASKCIRGNLVKQFSPNIINAALPIKKQTCYQKGQQCHFQPFIQPHKLKRKP